MRSIHLSFIPALFLLIFTTHAQSQTYKLQPFLKGLNRPVKFAYAPGEKNRFYILEQPGLVRIVENGRLIEKPALDLTKKVYSTANETGLLGIAFHPDYQKNKRLFLNYTTKVPDGQLRTHISEFAGSANTIDPKSEQVLLKIDQPYSNHNGGEVVFGPDGYLYIGMGDGGSGGDPQGNGQNLETLLGKMLRIDVNSSKPYGIPNDNPEFKNPKARPEIYAYGLRNPWRFSFDRQTGDLWTGDVGQNSLEEVDIIQKGKNYGWNVMEGFSCFKPNVGCNQVGLEKPIKDYPRSEGISVTGGYVYRGKKLPALVGSYVYGDFGTGYIWGLKQKAGRLLSNNRLISSEMSISAFGEDPEGELYVVSLGGDVMKMVAN